MNTHPATHDLRYLPRDGEDAWALLRARTDGAIEAVIHATADDPARLHTFTPGPASSAPPAVVHHLLAARCATESAYPERCEELLAAIGGRDAESAVAPADEAWARGTHASDTWDGMLAQALHVGYLMLGAANNIASVCWDADRAECVASVASRLARVAQGDRRGETALWAHPMAWARMDRSDLADPAALSHDDHVAALVLWRALVAGETERYPGDTQPLGTAVLSPTPYQDAIFFGAYGRERLTCARALLDESRAGARARGPWMFRRFGGPEDDPDEFGHLTPCAHPAAFRRRARHALFAPEAYGDGNAGREIIVPVSAECLAALWAEYRDDDACEGLRVMQRADGYVPARHLVLTLAVRDEDGPRRVSAACADGTLSPEAHAATLQGALQGEFTWTQETWLADTGAPAVAARTDVLGRVPCAHTTRVWVEETFVPEIIEQQCRTCGATLLRAHRYQLTPAPGDLEEDETVRWARTWAALSGDDPETIPGTLAALRARAETVSAFCRPAHQPSLRAHLAGRARAARDPGAPIGEA